MDLQALRHCPEFEPRSNKGPVGLKIHSLSLGKIQLDSKILHNWLGHVKDGWLGRPTLPVHEQQPDADTEKQQVAPVHVDAGRRAMPSHRGFRAGGQTCLFTFSLFLN